MEKIIINKNQKKIFFIGFSTVIIVLSVFLFFFFIKAVKYRKLYNISRTPYNIFHHSNKRAEEDPIEIVSQFRGDDMKTGVAEGRFNIKGQTKHLFKKINGSLHGASKATPAVDESGIYIGADSGWFYKLSHQGELIWKTYFAKAYNGIHGTALLGKKYLWVGAYNGILYCLKKKTGEVIWSIDLGDAIGSSPSFYKDQIIISVELVIPRPMGYVASVSARDGRLKWKSPLTPAHIHSSVAVHSKKGYGVTGANNGFLFKIDLNSGKFLWSVQLKGDIKSTPLIYKDRIYVTNWGNQFAAVSEEGKIVWLKNIKNRSQSSPTLIPDKGYLVFASHSAGWLFSISVKDGTIVWRKKISNETGMASAVGFFSELHNKYLFLFPCELKSICVVDPANGNFLKKIKTNFLLTGSFGVFKEHFYTNLNKGGVLVLY